MAGLFFFFFFSFLLEECRHTLRETHSLSRYTARNALVYLYSPSTLGSSHPSPNSLEIQLRRGEEEKAVLEGRELFIFVLFGDCFALLILFLCIQK